MQGAGHRRALWKLALLLAPFATAAVAINLFLLGLLLPRIGAPALSPVQALLWALPLGVPATMAAALWVRRLIAQAEHQPSQSQHEKRRTT